MLFKTASFVRYNRTPGHQQPEAEAKKSKFDVAEYDQAFIDRIMDMGYEEMLAYLHSLPAVERKAMEEAIFRAIGHRVLKDQIEGLGGGLIN